MTYSKAKYRYIPLLILLIFNACSDQKNNSISFTPENPNYTFLVENDKDTIIGGKGKVTFQISSNSFVKQNGSFYSGLVILKLTEAFSPLDMIENNLSTLSNGEILSSHGMFHLEAEDKDGQKLKINPTQPLSVSISTFTLDPEMKLYDGLEQNGILDWQNPIKQSNKLEAVPINELDFTPSNFRSDVLKMEGYEHLSNHQLDSLYYNLQGWWTSIESVHETSYLPHNKVFSFVQDSYFHRDREVYLRWPFDIKPSESKTLKSPELENSNISTLAFQQRFQEVLISENEDFTGIYLQNLDRPLYYSDSIVLATVPEGKAKRKIQKFFNQRDGMVQKPPSKSLAFGKYFKEKAKRIEDEFNKAFSKISAKRNAQLIPTKEELETVVKLKVKRDAHRLPQYGFVLSSTGWKNIDKGNDPKDWKYGSPQILVSNQENYSILKAYVIFPEEKSLIRLSKESPVSLLISDTPIPIRKFGQMKLVVVGYDEADNMFFGAETISCNQSELKAEIELKAKSKTEIDRILSAYSNWNQENQIQYDLELTKFKNRIAKEKLKQAKEDLSRNKLFLSAFAPIHDPEKGRALFQNNCASCHSLHQGQVIAAPSLYAIYDSWPLNEATLFSMNPLYARSLGLPSAIHSIDNYSGTFGVMPSQALNERELVQLFLWIASSDYAE